jgi:hypothetical protein
MSLDEMLRDVASKGERLAANREAARPECIAAVRSLEKALVEALDGEKLRGLPILYDDDGGEFGRIYGARVRGKKIEGTLTDRPILVLREDGRLWMRGIGYASPAGDEDLLMEDVEDFPRAIEEVLRRHLAVVDQKIAKHERFLLLAEKIRSCMST